MSFLGTIFQFMAFARYNASAPTTSSAQPQELQCDINGNLLVNIAAQGGNTPTSWNDFAPSSYSGVIKNAGGKLFSLYAANVGASTRYLMLFDAAALPANGAVPKIVIPLAVNDADLFPFVRPKSFTTGIVWGASSTATTLTIDATATIGVNAEYV